jgi:hypothetical protein
MARRSRSQALATQAAELAFAAPRVVAHRLGRMALAGARPSARDRREFTRMGSEKSDAFAESWLAMGATAWRLQLDFWLSCWGLGFSPWLGRGGKRTLNSLADSQRAAVDILASGLAPVHRRAVANAKRLGRVSR